MGQHSTIVIYRSFLGSTKQYAEWIAEDLGCDRMLFQQVTSRVLGQYASVVIMSGTYLGWMPLVSFLKKHWPALKDKRVFVAAVGMVPPESPASEVSYHSIPEGIRAKIWYIKIPGRLIRGTSKNWVMKRENIQRIVSAVRIDGQ